MPGLDLTLWNGLFVPAGTPQAVKDKLAEVAAAAMQTQAAQDLAKATGAEVYLMGADEAKARIVKDYATAEALVKAAE